MSWLIRNALDLLPEAHLRRLHVLVRLLRLRSHRRLVRQPVNVHELVRKGNARKIVEAPSKPGSIVEIDGRAYVVDMLCDRYVDRESGETLASELFGRGLM